jgi:putative peptidoglycan lipid II flippase
MILIIIGKVVAFGKDITISSFFGAGLETDAFFIALNITSILFIAFYSTVSLVFLPLYTEQKIKSTTKETNVFVSNIINLYLLLSLSIMLLSIIFAPQIIEIVNSSSNILNKNLSIDLLRIMALSFLFSIFISFMTSIQLSNNQYLYIHFTPIINNSIIALAIILFAPKYGIYVPAIAGVIAWVIQVPFHKWITRKNFRYSFYLDLKDKNLQKMGFLFLPAFLGISIDQANIMVDTVLASSLQEGSVSALNYSNRLISFSSGIFVMAIMSIMYPMFSKYVVNEEIDKLGQAIQKSMRLLLLVMVPITAIILVYNQEIVSIVFQRGKFDTAATTTTASVFFFYGLGIIFLALRELFNKVFYAQKNTKIPLLISFIAVSINIILSIIFVKSMGVEGLAFASSISLFVYVILQILILKNKIGKEFYYGMISYTAKLLFSIAIAIVLMWKYKKFDYFENIYLSFISGILLGFLTYIIILFFMKNEDITKIYMLLKSKIVKRI